MSSPAHEETSDFPVVSDLDVGPERPAPGASSEPIWLFDLELPAPPEPEPAPTPAMPRKQVEQLLARSLEDDPFEAFLKANKVTANEPHALAEPTVVDPNPLGAAGERWWIDPPKASPPRQQRRPTGEFPKLTPPSWFTARKTTEMRAPRPTPPTPLAPPPLPLKKPARLATLMGGVLAGALGVLLLGSSTSSATQLMVPPPPPAPTVELEAVRIEQSAPVNVPSPLVGERDRVRGAKAAGSAELKRERAKKKWAAEEWPETEPAAQQPQPEEEARPQPSDELKRPAF